ncbi:hypothetical protein QR680_006992 [Steinernema hermaphroditum]|uniref:Saposin B-type domain-containing protein n=1 Tax=Steinernema hermaphroditum TaxID=289476 RepID=A0AA39HX61_9BILA|nr:hypothetical protein QR680_006992 [Steinernema hermaphroditum]
MKAQLALICLLVVAVSSQTSHPNGYLKTIECHICYDIVNDTEQWIEKNLSKQKEKIISRCEWFFHLFHAADMSKRFCDQLLDHGFDDILKRLSDPEQAKKDAAAVCGDLHACPRQ